MRWFNKKRGRNGVGIICLGKEKDVSYFCQYLAMGMDLLKDQIALVLDPVRGGREIYTNLKEPTILLFIALQDKAGFIYKGNHGDEDRKYLPREWWTEIQGTMDIYFMACESRGCYEKYGIRSIARGAICYKDGVRMFLGSRSSRKLWKSIMKDIGRTIVSHKALDLELKKEIENIYIWGFENVLDSFDRAKGDIINLLLLEEQLGGIENM